MLTALMLLAQSALAVAQVSPPQPRLQDILPPLPGLEQVEPDPGITVPTGRGAEPAEDPGGGPRFRLRSVAFEGNTVFPDEVLASVAQPFLGQEIGTEELETLRRLLTRQYVDAGYVNSGALLPDQTITEGRVTFAIIEGALDDIELTGAERMTARYLDRRIRLAAGPPLNVNELQRKLRLMLDDPLIHRIDAELSPGLRLGQGRLRLTVEEAPLLSVSAKIDNALQPSVGGEQVGATLVLRNATGLGEIVSLSPTFAEGFVELSANFGAPVSRFDTRLIGRALYSRSEIVEDPFDVLDIESESYEIGIGILQPLYRAPGRALTLALTHDYRVNKTFLLDDPFSFSEGAENGRTAVSVIRGTLEWVDRSQEQVVALRSVLSVGTGLFDATTHDGSTPDSEFVSWLGQGQWVRRLGKSDTRVVLRGQAQWTTDRLLPMEKFSVGGVASVRGYREDLQTGDRGWNASLELQIPVLETPSLFAGGNSGGGRVTLIPFIDAGRAWNVDEPKNDTLVSAGAGLVWDINRSVRASLFFGRGLINRPDPADDDIQDIGLHFSLSANLY